MWVDFDRETLQRKSGGGVTSLVIGGDIGKIMTFNNQRVLSNDHGHGDRHGGCENHIEWCLS